MAYQIDPTLLTQVTSTLATSGNYDPDPDGTTKCNLFLNDTAQQAFKYTGFQHDDGTVLLANDIVDLLKTGVDGWTKLFDQGSPDLQASFQDAQNGANQGYLVAIGLKIAGMHGHVCCVVPGKLTQSTQWQQAGLPSNLPVVAQAGKTVFAGKCLSFGISAGDYDPNNFVIYVRQGP